MSAGSVATITNTAAKLVTHAAASCGQHRTLSPKAWSDVLVEHGCQHNRRRIDGKTVRIWQGVRLRTETDDMQPDSEEPL